MKSQQMLTLNDSSGAGSVYGMHEGNGIVHWKRLASGGMLDGMIQGMDYARLPAGSLVGDHFHISTAEVWVILEGKAAVTIDGIAEVLVPGDVLYTPVGASHSIANAADATTDVVYLVITLSRPSRVLADGGYAALGNTEDSEVDAPLRAESQVCQLGAAGDEPLRFIGKDTFTFAVSTVALPLQELLRFDGESVSQQLLYTLDGGVRLQWQNAESILDADALLAVPRTEYVELGAASEAPCRVLVMQVSPEEDAA